MHRYFYRPLLSFGLLFCSLLSSASAGNLSKADIERMVDYFYVVGDILPDLPVYPLFVKEATAADAKPELRAYVFESLDFAPARGYSGKPINLLIIMDLSGNFLRLRLLDHKEPLFLDSAGTLKLEQFASQYKGLSTRHSVEIGPYNDPGLRDERVAHVKGVQQGTISVRAINRAILNAAAAVATAKLKIGAEENPMAHSPPASKESKEIKEPREIKEPKPDLRPEVKPLLTAEESKGTSVNPKTELTDQRSEGGKDSRPLGLAEKKAEPTLMPQSTTQSGPPPAKTPSAALANQGVSDNASTVSAYQPAPAGTGQVRDTQPALVPANRGSGVVVPSDEVDDWITTWQSRSGHITVLLTGLALLSVALIAQKRFSASQQRMRRLRTLYLLFTLVFIGWIAQGQLTIVNITAALEALTTGGDVSFLMNDPMTVILWAFVGITLLVWGRGTFCGWLCPFGAFQELVSLVANAVGYRQRRLRAALDVRLKGIKYLILAILLVSSLAAPPLAELAVEVEPFKTAISLYFMRDWPYVLWAVFCLVLSVVVYRGYCRYLCPLGAALASVGFLRLWSWIPRKQECGTPCQTCRHRCEYQAISPSGEINYRECFQCLDCVSIYQDPQRCFPLIHIKKASAQAALPM